ncbi:wax ester/triacylglycerol synthase family O-acyltransferase [Moraxella sp. ZY210820]|uniref:WS/DGAT/MGAT family O-acyltransferase n=1 Tax=unclassified Moraxella TaxID=2685852 RepID=UPI00272FB771|nr:wax ester/triacylglycerol synthase family O-acyltransferase [Moraxella sp. ZY210820]WLF84775.1 wax ester/triacylglycerol synthase family O-acyltransferase [Moraxella sp. ZY210820]
MNFNKRSINPTDFLFLSLEKRRQPMHIGGLLLFKIPDDAPADYIQQAVQHFRATTQPPMPPYSDYLNGLTWEKDEEFDLDHHFRHVALPAPAQIKDLLRYISQEHSALLDRAKPMWTCTLIEGIEGNRFAIYLKIHHALADGVGAMRMIKKSLSHSADDPHFVPIWCLNPNQQSSQRTAKPQEKLSFTERVKNTLKSSQTVLTEIGKNIITPTQQAQHIPIYQAPKSILNQKIHASRRFSAQSYQLQRLRHIAQHFDVKINDIILAMCSGALRLYLQNHAQLPEKPLIAMVPASLRDDDTHLGNRITMILASLATDIAEPVQRLKAIQQSVQQSKNRMARMTSGEILAYTGLSYGVIGLQVASGAFPKHQSFNVIISSFITSQEPLYLNGAKLEAMYPASVVVDGQAMNITVATYLDQLDVGVIACRQSLPKVQKMLKYFEQTLQEYEKIITSTVEK